VAIAVSIMVSIAVPIVAPIVAEVPIMVAVPSVIVLESTPAAVPVAVIEQSAFITRPDPTRALIRRPAPVTLVPSIVVPYRIPIPVHPKNPGPGETGARNTRGSGGGPIRMPTDT